MVLTLRHALEECPKKVLEVAPANARGKRLRRGSKVL